MLSYTPVTDLVRHTDDPANADNYLALRGGGDRAFRTRHLRARGIAAASAPRRGEPGQACG